MKRIAYAAVAAESFAAGLWLAGARTWQLWAFAVAPDLTLLAGVGRGLDRRQLHPRAVPAYNAAHRLPLPLGLAGALGVLAVLGILPRTTAKRWLAAPCAWLVHIAADRALGLRLRDSRGFQRPA